MKKDRAAFLSLWKGREGHLAERVRLLESQVAHLAERVTHLEEHAVKKQFRRGQL